MLARHLNAATRTETGLAHPVIGAGVMGAGIAQWLRAHQLPVILRDLNTEQVAKGIASIGRLHQEGVRRHVLTPHTSVLPVSELAAATEHPERMVGLHFFNPVRRMQLVEIMLARQTSPAVLLRAIRFTQQIGKLPVGVKDSPGFLVNRILMPYIIEAGNLFESAANLTNLDEAMLDFGMPMGPMRLLDEVGVDVTLPVARTPANHFSDRMQVPGLLEAMVQAGQFGRKSGTGFCVYSKSREPGSNPHIMQLRRSAISSGMSCVELQERMVLLMVNEAARCREEEIIADPADVDFAMVVGTGFAPFRGGPLRYAGQIGIARLVGAMDILADRGAHEPAAGANSFPCHGALGSEVGTAATAAGPPG